MPRRLWRTEDESFFDTKEEAEAHEIEIKAVWLKEFDSYSKLLTDSFNFQPLNIPEFKRFLVFIIENEPLGIEDLEFSSDELDEALIDSIHEFGLTYYSTLKIIDTKYNTSVYSNDLRGYSDPRDYNGYDILGTPQFKFFRELLGVVFNGYNKFIEERERS